MAFAMLMATEGFSANTSFNPILIAPFLNFGQNNSAPAVKQRRYVICVGFYKWSCVSENLALYYTSNALSYFIIPFSLLRFSVSAIAIKLSFPTSNGALIP